MKITLHCQFNNGMEFEINSLYTSKFWLNLCALSHSGGVKFVFFSRRDLAFFVVNRMNDLKLTLWNQKHQNHEDLYLLPTEK